MNDNNIARILNESVNSARKSVLTKSTIFTIIVDPAQSREENTTYTNTQGNLFLIH